MYQEYQVPREDSIHCYATVNSSVIMSAAGGPRIVYEAGPEDMVGDDVEVQDQQHGGDGDDEAAKPNAAPTLSKSWAVSSAHVPSYTGGKVMLCRGPGTKNLYGRKPTAATASADDDDDAVMNDGDDEAEGNTSADAGGDGDTGKPFLLAPCGGDLSLIDATRGVRARTLRTGCSTSHASAASIANYDEAAMGDDDDDDGALDRDALTAYALAPNDADLVVCSRDSILRQYDLSGSASSYGGELGEGPAKVRRTIGKSGHDLPVTHIEFHCSGIFFATGSVDGCVKVWDLRGGYATHSFRPPAGGRGGASAVSRLAWQPDATRLILAIGREDGSICLHDLRSETSDVPIVRTTDHVSAVTCMVWAGKDRGLFITAGRDAIINTWSVEEEVIDAASAGNQQGRKKKKRRKDGASAPTTTKIVYRRVCTLPVYEQIEGMVVLPHYYHYHPDLVNTDIVIATAGSKGVVRVWRASKVDAKEGFQDSRLSTVGDFQCVAEQDARSAFGEQRGGYMGLLRTSHRNRLRISASSHCPEELIAIDAEHNMSFLNLEGRSTDTDSIVEGKAVLRMDRTIVGHNDEILDLRVIPSATPTSGDNMNDASAPPPAQKVAVATNSAQIRIFELGTYSCSVLDGHTETVLSIDVSPCGRYLSSCGKDKTMRLWHVESGKCVAIATGHTEAIGASALSRKLGRYDVGGKSARNGGGAFALTASKDRTLKRWALPGSSELDACAAAAKDGEELSLRSLNSVRAHEKDINIVSVAPNDSLVATGSQDKTVKLWNSSDLSLRGTIRGHKRGVWDCQFSPFDRVLATCSGDRTVKLWSLSDLSCVRTFQGHAASTLRVRFLGGGLQLMSSGADGLVKLWTIRTNECEATMDGHNDKVWALDLHQDGTTFVSGGADSRIIVWNDTTKELEDAKRDEEEKNILMEQRLSNHLRFKEYEKALEIALELDKPRQALKVLTAIIENDVQKGQNSMSTLKDHVKSWPMSRTTQVLRYCRDWNTRARNSHVAMLTVRAIVSSIPAQTLAAADGVPELMAGIMPYAERHFQRLDKLYTSSYLIDYTLMTMGTMDDEIAEDYSTWETNQANKLVLPPTKIDGKIQVGGTVAVGGIKKKQRQDDESEVEDEVVTVGESGSESSSSSESESDNDE